jgi:oligo-1,6-glucosidase
VESAKMLATFLHTLQGTPYIYQGEEIGMTNVKFDSIEEYKDIETLNMYHEKVKENNEDQAKVMESIYVKGRDNARTPVQWNDSEHAGFTTGTPWIAVNPNYEEVNVEKAIADPDSIYHYYKKLIQLRKENDVIVYGKYDLLLDDHEQIYAYTRTRKKEKLLVILNFSDHRPVFKLPEDIICRDVEVLISNYEQPEEPDVSSIKLRPYEAVVYKYR